MAHDTTNVMPTLDDLWSTIGYWARQCHFGATLFAPPATHLVSGRLIFTSAMSCFTFTAWRRSLATVQARPCTSQRPALPIFSGLHNVSLPVSRPGITGCCAAAVSQCYFFS